jgi:hypothetical protein
VSQTRPDGRQPAGKGRSVIDRLARDRGRQGLLGVSIAAVVMVVVVLTYLGCQPRHPAPGASIQDDLLDPVAITMNGIDRGHLAPGETETFTLDRSVSVVDFALVGRHLRSGKALGDDMVGRLVNVEEGASLTVGPHVGPPDAIVTYFTPRIAKRSDRGCDVAVDALNSTTRRLGVTLGQGDETRFGYFRFDIGMHVFVDCGGRVVSWNLDPLSKASGGTSVGDPVTGELALGFDARFEESPSPGESTLGPTPTPTVPPQGCATPETVSWVNHEPIFDLSIHPTLGPCQTIMVSSASFSIPNGPSWAEGETVVCVAVARVDDGSVQFPVDQLGGASWYGLTASSIDAAINDKIRDTRLGWFSSSNCGRQSGCSKAVVHVRRPDGTYERRDINHP